MIIPLTHLYHSYDFHICCSDSIFKYLCLGQTFTTKKENSSLNGVCIICLAFISRYIYRTVSNHWPSSWPTTTVQWRVVYELTIACFRSDVTSFISMTFHSFSIWTMSKASSRSTNCYVIFPVLLYQLPYMYNLENVF